MTVIIFFLTLIMVLGNPRKSSSVDRPSLADQPVRYYYCENENSFPSTLLFVVEILVLLIAIRASLVISGVPDGVNETKQILTAVIVVVILAITEVIIVLASGFRKPQKK
mmetsp:Transcript_6580/g.6813  ORF Transcript_6580/g.6813 Transcript_6580/m.6813 type:complete len:110 (+) Transcript_6580:2-331(+)